LGTPLGDELTGVPSVGCRHWRREGDSDSHQVRNHSRFAKLLDKSILSIGTIRSKAEDYTRNTHAHCESVERERAEHERCDIGHTRRLGFILQEAMDNLCSSSGGSWATVIVS
jgi:hypothetical protein